jgi:hypothetical protein
MPTNTGRPGAERRIVIRRTRGQGARFTSAGRMDGAPRDIEHDEVDEAIDPEAVDDHVRNLSRMPPRPEAPDPYDPTNPRQRMMDVEEAGDAAYSKEYRMTMLHRLLLRKMPIDQIARALGVSISTVQKDRVKLKALLREHAKDLNIDEMIGNQMGLYDEIGAMSLRIATKTSGEGSVPIPMQLAAMRTTLASQADKTRFLTSAGVFDVLRFRKADTGESQSDIALLMEETRRMLAALQDGDDMGAFGAFNTSDPEVEHEEL